MHVIHIASSFPRRVGDGFVPYLLDLTAGVAASGARVSAVVPHGPGLAEREELRGVDVHRFRYGRDRQEVLAYQATLLQSIRRRPTRVLRLPAYVRAAVDTATHLVEREGGDVLHAHWTVPAGLIAATVAKRTGVPFVVTGHGTDVVASTYPGFKQVSRHVLRRAGAVTAVSDTLRGRLETLFPGVAVEVVRMPVQLPDADPAPLPAGPPFRVVAVGRLSREKGFDVLVEAIARARAAGLDVSADIVGEGPEREALEAAAAERGVADHVRFRGLLPRAELPAVFADAHASVAPSRREGLGLAALDAIACGRPVIASRVGGLPEAVRDGEDGVLIPADDPDALAEALTKLPLAAPLGHAVADHHPDAVVRAHLDLYERVLRQRHR